MLIQTPLKVECGVDLTVTFTMHEELLCCHSKLLADRFAEAKPLREQYKRIKNISDKLSAYFFPNVTPKQFEEAAFETQVRSTMMAPLFTSLLIRP